MTILITTAMCMAPMSTTMGMITSTTIAMIMAFMLILPHMFMVWMNKVTIMAMSIPTPMKKLVKRR